MSEDEIEIEELEASEDDESNEAANTRENKQNNSDSIHNPLPEKNAKSM